MYTSMCGVHMCVCECVVGTLCVLAAPRPGRPGLGGFSGFLPTLPSDLIFLEGALMGLGETLGQLAQACLPPFLVQRPGVEP